MRQNAYFPQFTPTAYFMQCSKTEYVNDDDAFTEVETRHIGAVGAHHPRDPVFVAQPHQRRDLFPAGWHDHVIRHFGLCKGAGITGIGGGNRYVVGCPLGAHNLPHPLQQRVLNRLFNRAYSLDMPRNMKALSPVGSRGSRHYCPETYRMGTTASSSLIKPILGKKPFLSFACISASTSGNF